MFYKLREWVGTGQAKALGGVGTEVGRSEPAFMAASTTVLPHLPARRAGRQHLQLLFLLRGWPSVAVCLRPEPGGGSAGCVACSACSAGCVPAFTLCLPCPLPFSSFAPVQGCLPPSIQPCFVCHLFIAMCARIVV